MDIFYKENNSKVIAMIIWYYDVLNGPACFYFSPKKISVYS